MCMNCHQQKRPSVICMQQQDFPSRQHGSMQSRQASTENGLYSQHSMSTRTSLSLSKPSKTCMDKCSMYNPPKDSKSTTVVRKWIQAKQVKMKSAMTHPNKAKKTWWLHQGIQCLGPHAHQLSKPILTCIQQRKSIPSEWLWWKSKAT